MTKVLKDQSAKMRIYLHILVLLTATVAVQAQRIDQVYLRSGNRVEGQLVSYDPELGARIMLPDSTVVLILEEDIWRLDFRIARSGAMKFDTIRSLPTGWSLGTYVGTSFGQKPFFDPFTGEDGDRTFLGVHVQQSLEYQWETWLELGLGVGFEGFDLDAREYLWSVFGRVGVYPFKGKWLPKASVDVGYGRPFRNEKFGFDRTSGGLLLHPAVGFARPLPKDRWLTFDIGYRWQAARYSGTDEFNQTIDRDLTYRRLLLRVGLNY